LGLIAAAEEQQTAAKTAIEGLAAERAALARAVQGIQKAAGEAVEGAARQALACASETAVGAFTKAAEPFTRKVEDVADKASEAAERVNSAARWIGVKAAVFALIFALVCIVVVSLAAWVSLAWEHHQVNDLSAKVVELRAQIAQERATVAELDKHGGKAKLNSCGSGRLCVQVDTKAGKFSYGDGRPIYMVIKGY
jgi:cell division protein FtsB